MKGFSIVVVQTDRKNEVYKQMKYINLSIATILNVCKEHRFQKRMSIYWNFSLKYSKWWDKDTAGFRSRVVHLVEMCMS